MLKTSLENTVCIITTVLIFYLEVRRWLWVHTIQIYSKHCDNIQ